MRPIAVAKLGFYPAPDAAIDALLSHLTAEPGATMLDPCCGEGAALDRLRAGLGVAPERAIGIELDEGRVERARATGMTVTGPASFLGCAVKPAGALSFVWCNPPFDDELGGGGRQEEAFVRAATRALRPGGVLAMATSETAFYPWSQVGLRAHFDCWYERVVVFRWDEAWRRFNEITVVGVKRERPLPDEAKHWRLKYDPPSMYGRDVPPTLGRSEHRWTVPTAAGDATIVKLEHTDVELARLVERSPLNRLLEPPPPLDPPGPPLELREGHVALLLVSGRCDGLIRPPGGEAHVIRGGSRKERFLKEETTSVNDDGEATTVQKWAERAVPCVRVLRADGAITTLEM